MSHSIYLLETQFQVALRTVAKLQPLIARQRKKSRQPLSIFFQTHTTS
ncbi:hypothetical protein [Pilibacter termitis]|nr:hypothetical protein [Pilibacter termitis]